MASVVLGTLCRALAVLYPSVIFHVEHADFFRPIRWLHCAFRREGDQRTKVSPIICTLYLSVVLIPPPVAAPAATRTAAAAVSFSFPALLTISVKFSGKICCSIPINKLRHRQQIPVSRTKLRNPTRLRLHRLEQRYHCLRQRQYGIKSSCPSLRNVTFFRRLPVRKKLNLHRF